MLLTAASARRLMPPLPAGQLNCQLALTRRSQPVQQRQQQQRQQRQQNHAGATSMLINPLLLLTMLALPATHATLVAMGGGGGFPGDHVGIGNYESAAAGPMASLEATSALTSRAADSQPLHYYRRRQQQQQQQQQPDTATAISYANYFGNSNYAAAAETPFQVQGNAAAVAATANGFVPTTLTAAGQHYRGAAAAAAMATQTPLNVAVYGDYESEGVGNGERDGERDGGGVDGGAEGAVGNEANMAYYSEDNNDYQQHSIAAPASASYKADFGVYNDGTASRRPHNVGAQQPYLRDYEFEQSANYRQQHTKFNPLEGDHWQQRFYNDFKLEGSAYDASDKPIYRRPTQQQHKLAQAAAEANESDSEKSASEHYYNHGAGELYNNAVAAAIPEKQPDATNHVLQHLQAQLHRQQQHFVELQQQLILSANHKPIKNLPTNHQLPSITTTVHHTPQSAAAIAGTPLARHVQLTRHVPVPHYHQVHVPYNHTVPIPIPHPVINTVPRPVAIQVPVHKTIAVPQLQDLKIAMERVRPYPVERAVPYLVERRVPYRVERPVATPVYYPYPIKVPIIKTVLHRHPHGGRHHTNSIFADHHLG